MNRHLYFEIQADDTSRARHFYNNVFGWQFEKADGLPVEYWRIETGPTAGASAQAGGARGVLLKRPAKTPPPECGTNAFVCSVEIEDFDKTAQEIVRLGGQVALPKFAVPGKCWQGYFVDTEGNTFGIFQVDEASA